MSKKQVVLIGGGHAHVLVLNRWPRESTLAEVTLLSDVEYAPYSGMLPGHLAGHYSFEQIHFHLPSVCKAAGAKFILASASRIDASDSMVSTSLGEKLSYDVASVDIGCKPSLQGDLDTSLITPLKPVSTLIARWNELLEKLQRENRPSQLAVVGGGAAGFEVSMALLKRLKELSVNGSVTMFEANAELLPGRPQTLQAALARSAESHGLKLVLGAKIASFRAGQLETTTGIRFPCDHAIWATQAHASDLFTTSRLETDPQGFLSVDHNLRSLSSKTLFGAGDCISFPTPLPKAGVYPVRQAPTLLHNLQASLAGEDLVAYKPQRNALALISAGDRYAFGTRGIYLGGSRLHWWLKDAIDRKFMRLAQ